MQKKEQQTKDEQQKKPSAYSYLRFSSKKQGEEGRDSKARQEKSFTRAIQQLKNDGIEVDLVKEYRDEGVSAWNGKNKDEGELAKFLEQVKIGTIERGSYLIIEKLDRASRQVPMKVLNLISELLQAGINVVTADPFRVYGVNALNDTFSLFEIVVSALRANEESETKSKRIKEAWVRKYENAKKNIVTAKLPAWCQITGDKIVAVKERAELIRKMFKWAIEEELGQRAIAKRLNKQKVPVWPNLGRKNESGLWGVAYTRLILTDERATGKAYDVDNYLPQIIDRETFDRVQLLTRARKRFAGRHNPKVHNLFQGIAYDVDTQSTLVTVKKKPSQPYRLTPSACVQGAKARATSFPLPIFEDCFLLIFAELKLNASMNNKELNSKITRISMKINALAKEIDQNDNVDSLLPALINAETERKQLYKQLAAVNASNDSKHLILQLDTIKESEKPEFRAKLKARIRSLVERIDVKPSQQGWRSWCEVTVTLKSGRIVAYTIHNRRGKFQTLTLREGDFPELDEEALFRFSVKHKL